MAPLGITNRLLLMAILWGCNNPLSSLDRGQIKVNGLSKPQGLIPSIVRNANQGEAIRAGEYQTRQSVNFMIPEDILAQGSDFSLRRKLPEPSQDITAAAPVPALGSSVTSGDITVEHLAAGGAKITFYVATLINAKSLIYGDNTLEFNLIADGAITYKVDVILKVKDFPVTGPAMVGMLKSQLDGSLKSEAWISDLKQATVTSTQDSEQSQSFLRSGLMSIINP